MREEVGIGMVAEHAGKFEKAYPVFAASHSKACNENSVDT